MCLVEGGKNVVLPIAIWTTGCRIKMKNVKYKTMEQEQQQWRKLSGERIKISIADEVTHVLKREREAGHELKVCIGTDSQVKARPNGKAGRGKETEFATVIVFIRKGKGGFMYIHNEV